MSLPSEYPQLILYNSHASAHDSVLAVRVLQPSECRVLTIPTSMTLANSVAGQIVVEYVMVS